MKIAHLLSWPVSGLTLALATACDPTVVDDVEDDTDTSDTTDTPSAPTWQSLDVGGDGRSLSTVWGTSSTDVWVGGGVDATGEVHHYDGNTWTQAAIPAVPMISWVFGFTQADVWAVGRGGGVLHFDGSAWTALDAGTADDLWGVWGTSSSDLWIVGGAVGAGDPLILHYDGAAFTETRLVGNPKAATAMFKVWGTGGAVFAVGEAGLVEQWDGAAWSAISAGPDADEDFVTLHGTSADHILAVGGRNSPRVAAWDGAGWTTSKPNPIDVRPLSAVYARSADELLVGGLYGFLATWQPSTGTFTAFPAATPIGIHAVWCASDHTCFAVGGTFAEPHRAAALKLAPVED
jgi:hypothetical protein